MMRLLFSPLLAVFLGMAAPCASAQNPDPTLKPNDAVRLTVFGEDDLTTQTRVLKSGEVVLPLIDTVKIGGLTISEANETIRQLYAAKYLVDPKVTLTIDEYSQDFISVIGAVEGPGQFPMPVSGKFDLSAAIASAGGLAPGANPHGIVLTRAGGGTSTHSISGIESGKVLLGPGDRVVVQLSPFVGKTATILGQVGKPGPIPFPIDGRLDIVTAIAHAGGFTQLANPKKVRINRNGSVTTINVREMTDTGNTRYFLHPDDIVTVAERFF